MNHSETRRCLRSARNETVSASRSLLGRTLFGLKSIAFLSVPDIAWILAPRKIVTQVELYLTREPQGPLHRLFLYQPPNETETEWLSPFFGISSVVCGGKDGFPGIKATQLLHTNLHQNHPRHSPPA